MIGDWAREELFPVNRTLGLLAMWLYMRITGKGGGLSSHLVARLVHRDKWVQTTPLLVQGGLLHISA